MLNMHEGVVYAIRRGFVNSSTRSESGYGNVLKNQTLAQVLLCGSVLLGTASTGIFLLEKETV